MKRAKHKTKKERARDAAAPPQTTPAQEAMLKSAKRLVDMTPAVFTVAEDQLIVVGDTRDPVVRDALIALVTYDTEPGSDELLTALRYLDPNRTPRGIVARWMLKSVLARVVETPEDDAAMQRRLARWAAAPPGYIATMLLHADTTRYCLVDYTAIETTTHPVISWNNGARGTPD